MFSNHINIKFLLKKLLKNNKILEYNLKSISSKNEVNPILGNTTPPISKGNKNHQKTYDLLKRSQKDNNPLQLSIIVPVYNEEKTIGNIIERLPNSELIEIIIVNDRSTDNSLNEIIKQSSKTNISIINHKKNKGYGAAILSGIKKSTGSIIITIDADGQHDPLDIYNLIKPIIYNEADCTIGSRYLGTYNYTLPVVTRLGEAIVEKCITLFFQTKVKNNQSGFRAFKREMIHIFQDIHYDGFVFATEIILKASIYNYRIKECPIILKDREHGSSKIILKILIPNLCLCFFRYILKKIKVLTSKKMRYLYYS